MNTERWEEVVLDAIKYDWKEDSSETPHGLFLRLIQFNTLKDCKTEKEISEDVTDDRKVGCKNKCK